MVAKEGFNLLKGGKSTKPGGYGGSLSGKDVDPGKGGQGVKKEESGSSIRSGVIGGKPSGTVRDPRPLQGN